MMDSTLSATLAVGHVLATVTLVLALPALLRKVPRITAETERRVIRLALVVAPVILLVSLYSALTQPGRWEWSLAKESAYRGPTYRGTTYRGTTVETAKTPSDLSAQIDRGIIGPEPQNSVIDDSTSALLDEERSLGDRTESANDAPLHVLPDTTPVRDHVESLVPARGSARTDHFATGQPEASAAIDGTVVIRSPGIAMSPWIERLVFVIVIAWGIGVSIRLGQLALSLRRLRALRDTWTQLGEPWESRLAARATTGSPRVTLYRVDRLEGAFACGFRRPAIAIPSAWCNEDRWRELEPILVHELAHHRSRDPLWRGVLWATTALLWPHPWTHRLARREGELCERIADDSVLAAGHDRCRYARLLGKLALSGHGPEPSLELALGMLGRAWGRGRESSLERRLKMILEPRSDAAKPRRRLAFAGLVVGLGLIAVFAAQPLVGAVDNDSARYPVMIVVKKGWWVAEGRAPEGEQELLWTVRLRKVEPDLEVQLHRKIDAARVAIGDQSWSLDAETGQLRPSGGYSKLADLGRVDPRLKRFAEGKSSGNNARNSHKSELHAQRDDLLAQRDKLLAERAALLELKEAANEGRSKIGRERTRREQPGLENAERRLERALRQQKELENKKRQLELELERSTAGLASREQTLALMRDRLAQVEARFDSGVATRDEVLEHQMKLSQLETELVDQTSQRALLQNGVIELHRHLAKLHPNHELEHFHEALEEYRQNLSGAHKEHAQSNAASARREYELYQAQRKEPENVANAHRAQIEALQKVLEGVQASREEDLLNNVAKSRALHLEHYQHALEQKAAERAREAAEQSARAAKLHAEFSNRADQQEQQIQSLRQQLQSQLDRAAILEKKLKAIEKERKEKRKKKLTEMSRSK